LKQPLTPVYVVKRDGSLVKYDSRRVWLAITKAANACESVLPDMTVLLAIEHRIMASVQQGQVAIETIQDHVEDVLIVLGYRQLAKTFMLYRERRRLARENARSLVDAEQSINDYLSRADWRVAANANQGYSLGGLILNMSGKLTANYWLNHIYPPEIGAAHRCGDFHIHDLDMLAGYCAGWSLRTLLNEGLNGIHDKVEAAPPKHMSSAIGQIVNFLGTMQNEWAGAQAFSSFDTYMAPFVRVDNLTYTQVKQQIQELIYNLNVPSRWGSQAPFTNLTFDWVCPDDLKQQVPLVGGVEQAFCYGDLQAEMDMINRAYIEVMTEGDIKGRVFTFPIPTYNITDDFPWESENAQRLFEMTAKFGLPYFQSFLNSDLEPGMVRSMCCRLQLDLRELLKRGNGLFGSAEQTGSIGVVTINCARLGYCYKGQKEQLLSALLRLIELAARSLELKRKTIDRLISTGLYPFTKRWLGTLRNHFSTIGVNGINELIRNFSGDSYDITSEEGQALALEILTTVRESLVAWQEHTGHLYNLEATPAEGCTYRFAREDQKRFAGIIQAGTADAPYYTNSSQLPVGFTDDPFVALELQDQLQTQYTGGTVLHLYMRDKVSSPQACGALVKRALSKFRLPYLTISPTFSICPKHGYLSGEHEFCPICDAELDAAKTS
jgi:anaerobic ribonucleoside-triphosphate reductase